MARKQTNIETLREQHRLAHIAFINAGSAYRAAEAALNKAVFAAAERKARQPRHEYAVVMLDKHGDGIDTRFHDTLAAARSEATAYLVSDDAEEVVGTVIERVRLSDGERTTVEWHGQVSAGWRGEETVECEYCERTLPAGQVTLASSGDITVSYCDDCRAKDAKVAHG